MKTFILCPSCKRKSYTRFRIIAEANSLYSLAVDKCLRIPKWNGTEMFFTYPSFKDLAVIRFACSKCSNSYPKKMQKEIRIYFKQRSIVWALQYEKT